MLTDLGEGLPNAHAAICPPRAFAIVVFAVRCHAGLGTGMAVGHGARDGEIALRRKAGSVDVPTRARLLIDWLAAQTKRRIHP